MKSTLELTKPGKAALMAACINALESPGSFVLGSDKRKFDVELTTLDPNDTLSAGDESRRRHVNYDADVYRELITEPDHLVGLYVTDRETGKSHVLTPYKLYKAWWKLLRNDKRPVENVPYCAQSYRMQLIALGLFGDDADPTDAYTSDILLQLAVFGDVIYG